jgi:cyclopropane fatty-acyl-phospholipid synthase-like methyltransferase
MIAADCKLILTLIVHYLHQILLKKILGLNESDLFLDFGHGVGNACLQAAYTVGCNARGIEVVSDRHIVACRYKEEMSKLHNRMQIVSRKQRRVLTHSFSHITNSDSSSWV